MALATSPHPTDAHLVAHLRGAGLRVTSQRLLLYRALTEIGSHATAEQVRSAVGDRLPGLSLPTVYSTLELFERLGLARRITSAGGPVLFDPRHDAHEHLVCRSCGRVVDVDVPVDAQRVLKGARRAGHEVDAVEVVLTGRCAECAAAGSSS